MEHNPPRKVALIASCLLNQNAKVCQGANYPGVVSPVVEALRSRGYLLQQLPCPELAFAGVRRWWAVYEQYDTPAYRAHCQRLAQAIAPLIEQYLRQGDELILIGLDGSPSTGVRFTSSQPEWGGSACRQFRPPAGRSTWAASMKPARGVTWSSSSTSGKVTRAHAWIRGRDERRCARLAHGAGARQTDQPAGGCERAAAGRAAHPRGQSLWCAAAPARGRAQPVARRDCRPGRGVFASRLRGGRHRCARHTRPGTPLAPPGAAVAATRCRAATATPAPFQDRCQERRGTARHLPG